MSELKNVVGEASVKETVNASRTFVMGCAMISIMLFHQPFLFPDYPIGIPFEFFHLVGYHGVEIFLFISGLGIAASLSRNNLRQYYRNRIQRIVPACLFVGTLKIVVKVAYGFNPEPTQNAIMIVTSLSLWYIEAIAIYYLLAPVLMSLISRFGFEAVVVFSAVCFIYGIMSPGNSGQALLLQSFSWAVQRLPVFMLGMYFFCRPQVLPSKTILCLGLALYFVCFVVIIQSHRVAAQWRADYVPYLVAYAAPALCVLCCLLKRLVDKLRLSYLVDWFGVYSLEIYLCHEWFYHLFRHIGPSPCYFVPAVACSVVFAFITKRACVYLSSHY